MKKVAIIGTAGVPGKYGGFETLVHHLVENLSNEFQLSVYCSKKYYKKEERLKYWKKARLYYLPFNANGIQSIIYDMVSIFHALWYADTLLILGVSGGIVVPLVKFFTRKNIVINIDGLEWRRNKWSKSVKKFLKLSEYLAVKFSDADIADNAAIKKYTAINYKTLSHQVEYGADHVIRVTPDKTAFQQYPFLKNPYAFKVCRIEPENNVHVILGAYTRMPDCMLVVVGNWQNGTYGQELKDKYGNGKYKNIILLDPIYDQHALDLLRSNCKVYVHGHSAGGTNPSLVEAMYLGLPVIAFNISYNVATTENCAFYFRDQEELIKILQKITPDDLVHNGRRMYAIAGRRYTWKIIALKYANLIYGFDYAYKKKAIHAKVSKLDTTTLLQNDMAHLKNTKMFYE